MVQWLERPSENPENVHIMLYGLCGNYTSEQWERGKRREDRSRGVCTCPITGSTTRVVRVE